MLRYDCVIKIIKYFILVYEFVDILALYLYQGGHFEKLKIYNLKTKA